MDVNEELVKILEQAKAEIVANMASKNISASGRTSNAFAVKKTEGGFALVLGDMPAVSVPAGLSSIMASGRAPLATLEVGRKGGRVPRGFFYIIRQWTIDKGLSFESEKHRNAVTSVIARKIAREGTTRHKSAVDVYSTAANTARDRITEIITKFIRQTIQVETTKLHK